MMVGLRLIVVVLGVMLAQIGLSDSQKGLELARKSDASRRGYIGEHASYILKIFNKKGEGIERCLDLWSMETASGEEKSRIALSCPLDVAGTTIISWTNQHRDDDQWLYLPSLDRVKRINSRNRTGSFLGSELSYEDLVESPVEKYDYNYLGDKVHEGKKYHLLERRSKSRYSGYKRQLMYLNPVHFQAEYVEFYDRKDELLKTADFLDYRNLNGSWRCKKVLVRNVKTGKWSELTLKGEHQVGVKLNDRLFDSRRLR